MKMRKINILIFTFSLLLLCNSAKAEIIDRVIAKVDDSIITLYDLKKLQSMLPIVYPDMNKIYTNLETKKEKDSFLLDMLINDNLIENELEKNGLAVNEDEVMKSIKELAAKNNATYEDFIGTVEKEGLNLPDYKKMIKIQIEKMKFYSLYINSKIVITDEEVNNFFKENNDFFRGSQKITIFYIQFLKSADNALALANSFLEKLKDNESHTVSANSFRNAAAAFADNLNVKSLGNITMQRKEFAKDFLTAIEKLEADTSNQAMRELGKGRLNVSNIIENDDSYSIIMLYNTEFVSIESYKDKIQQKIQSDKRDELYRSVISKLWQEHSVEIK